MNWVNFSNIISNLDLIKADIKEENNMLVLQNTQDEVEEVLVKFDILSSKVLSIVKELENMILYLLKKIILMILMYLNY